MKKCVNCGCELPQEAEFCPNCAASQTERMEVKPPRTWKKKTLIAICVLLVAIIAIAAVLRYHEPRTYIAGSSITYIDDDGAYLLLLSFDNEGTQRIPRDDTKLYMAPKETTNKPSQFFVYAADSDEDVQEEFMAKVKSVTVRSEVKSHEIMLVSAPAWSENFPKATLISNCSITNQTGDNDVIWTFEMKNGDTIELRHTVYVEFTQELEYRHETYDMSTAAKLQALIDQIAETSGEYDTITLYLPPVTYTEPLNFRNRKWVVQGAEGENRTTFTAETVCAAEHPCYTEFHNVDFLGNGSGTAIRGEMYVLLDGCTIRDWEIGIWAKRHAEPMNTVFENNGVGLRYETDTFFFDFDLFPGNTFRNNDVGVHIKQLVGEAPLRYDDCLFSGNGTDIVNDTTHVVDTSKAILE